LTVLNSCSNMVIRSSKAFIRSSKAFICSFNSPFKASILTKGRVQIRLKIWLTGEKFLNIFHVDVRSSPNDAANRKSNFHHLKSILIQDCLCLLLAGLQNESARFFNKEIGALKIIPIRTKRSNESIYLTPRLFHERASKHSA
jgi:hypothetical protein